MTARAVSLAALLAVPIAVPLAASAQNAGVAELADTEGEVNFIGIEECQGGIDTLRWTLNTGTGSFTLNGTYLFVVSDDPPVTSGADTGFCQDDDDENTTTRQIEEFVATVGPSSTREIETAAIPAALGLPCTGAPPDQPMYLCVEWLDSTGARAGFANVKLTLQLRPPPPPANVRVTPSEDALDVAWSAGSVGAGQVDSFEYEAVATAEGATTRRSRVRATSTRLEGLANGTTYSVVVTAYSEGNNASEPSAAVTATPIPIDDFWEHYQNSGGPDDGGCASGPAGLGALAGLALALAVRRRRA
jgi:hypothetical protein